MTRRGAVHHRGCALAVRVDGSGPGVLFVQGVGVHGDAWAPQLDALRRDFTCVSFDNRGIGRSLPAACAITVEQMADDARAIMDAESWTSAHVVGHSLGGLVALQLAISHPRRVRSLALLCTFAAGRAAAPLGLRMAWLGLRARVGTRRMRRQGFMRLVMPPGPLIESDALAQRLSALFGHDIADQPPVAAAQLQAMRAADLTGQLGALGGIPTLVVTARHDPIAPPSAGRALRDGIPGSRYVEVADASHGLPITHHALVSGLLRRHLEAS